MFSSIKPLKGKERFQMAPDWLKGFYSLLRSIGTDIEPEGGLFRLTASKQAIDKFYGRPMEVKELPQSCELVFSPAFAARETAYQQGRFVKYMDLIQQLKIALVANMDPDDIMAIIGTRTTDAFPLIDYFKYIESKLAKVDINRKRNVRQQYRLIADGETFGAYRAFLTKHHQDIADTQAGVEVNEFDKFTNLADGIQPHTQLALAYERYLQSLGDTPESFAALATFLEAQWATFHLTAKAAGYAASAVDTTPSARIDKIEEILLALTTATALAAGGSTPPPPTRLNNCYNFATTKGCKTTNCRFTHTPGPIVSYCWLCGAFGAGAKDAHTTLQCKLPAAKGLSADKKASTGRLLPGHKEGDAYGKTKYTTK